MNAADNDMETTPILSIEEYFLDFYAHTQPMRHFHSSDEELARVIFFSGFLVALTVHSKALSSLPVPDPVFKAHGQELLEFCKAMQKQIAARQESLEQ